MLKDEDENQLESQRNWKKYQRSVSWTERPQTKLNNSKPLWNNKARACLPPLQPLSITRPSIEEWPRAGSDDLGVWANNPPTPSSRFTSVTPREASTSNSDKFPREFEFRKDKLAFFDKECSRILDHIYLGSDSIAKDREVLRVNKITHVLNCVGFVCPEYFKNELVYKTLWLQDSPSEDITSILYDVFDYFEDVYEQGGRVLVHCRQGVSRSTSLVIAYLMWKEGRSFDEALQIVKAARGVTNPNLGFTCQLLLCQKRVHALPTSPCSLLRMYRLAPHSPYDPLHLVPKMVDEPGFDKIDSRGAFIIQIPLALYVWIGKHCDPVMSENASSAASQIFRYESVKGPVLIVKEGEETLEFWDALSYDKTLVGDSQKRLGEYDLDFEIFLRALSGGVVPPFPLSEAESETRLPFRENGWYRLRKKFSNGIVKEFITSSKKKSRVCEAEIVNGIEVEDVVSFSDLAMSSNSQCDSPDSFASYVTKEEEIPDISLSRSLSFDSFSSFLVKKPSSNLTSPSISPSNSDYSSSFTFSPSSSNWSDLSFASGKPYSPHGLESTYTNPGKSGPVEESIDCIMDVATSHKEKIPFDCTMEGKDLCSKFGDTLPSLVEHRGNHPPPMMILPSIDEASQNTENLSTYLEDDVMDDVECKM